MARVKVSKIPVDERIKDVVNILRGREVVPGVIGGDSYALGYMQGQLELALDLLPPGKRELFLARLEKYARPKTKKVTNLMSGEEVEIAYDTPLACDPSSETYWSM